LIYLSYRLAFCVGAAAIFVHGVVGALRRKITVRGKFGPAKTYVGAAAVREGIFLAFVGCVFSLLAAFVFWLLPAWQS
jgi:hypothetical protein